MKQQWVAAIIMLCVIVACKPTVPSDYIQPDDMEDILFDYHVAQAMGREANPRQSAYEENAYFMAVLKKHDVSKADFDSSLVYYYSHAERLKKIYANVSERLDNEANALGATTGELGRYAYSASGDTANVWKGASEVLLMPLPTASRYDFQLKADSSYHKGDSFMFQFNADYIYEAGSRDAVVCLLSCYEGDSIVQTVYHITMSGLSQIRVPAARDLRLKEMHGFIYLASDHQDRNVRRMMFISKMQLIRFHEQKSNEPTKQGEEINGEIKKDSLLRVDDAQRAVVDTAGGKSARGPRDRGVPIKQGIPIHGMDLKPLRDKK